MLNGKPQVLIYQTFETLNFAAPLPTLNVCICGPAYQVSDFVTSQASIATGAYGTLNGTSATSTGLAPVPTAIDLSEPPSNTPGAILDAASAQLWVTAAEVNLVNGSALAFTNNDNFLTGFTTDTAQGFVQAGVLPGDRVVLSDHTNNVTVARTVQNACLSFTDSAAAFIVDGVSPGNTLTITLPSAAAGFYTVQRVVSATVLYISQNTPDAVSVGTSATAYSVANGATVLYTTSGASAVIADTVLEVTSTLSTGAGTDINGNAYSALEDTGLVGRVERLVTSANVGGNGGPLTITPGLNAIVIDAGMTLPILLSGHNSTTSLAVNYALTYIAYRSLRQDLAQLNALTGSAAIAGAIGPIDERDPLAVGVFVATQNTASQVQYFGVTGDYINGATSALSSYTAAMTVLSSSPSVYCIVPLTQELAVIEAWSLNCTELAEPLSSIFQIVIGSGTAITQQTISPAGGISSTLTAQASPGSPTLVFTDAAGAFVTDGVAVGNSLVVSLSTASTLEGTYTVASVISNTELVVAATTPLPAAPATFTTVSYAIAAAATPISVTAHTVITRAFYNQLLDTTAAFITAGVIVGDLVQILNGANGSVVGAFPVVQINSNQVLTVSSSVGTELSENPGYTYYRVERNLTLAQQVTALSEVVASPGGLNNSRCTMIWPDEVLVAGVTNVLTGNQDVQPSYYAACAVGGMVAGLPSQQGFTFLPLGGIQQVLHSSGYFSQAQLNTLSGNGWFVCVQDNPSTPVYCMREMTTDTTSLETGELMVVKNFDYISIFFQGILKAFLGTYNVLPETIDALAAAFNAGAQELQNNYVAKIGAPLSAATLTSIAPLAGTADRIEMYATVTLPLPLNDIGLHLTA
jgi:hypothetical protein